MRVTLSYGTGSFDVEMPGRSAVRTAGGAGVPPLPDERDSLAAALERPVASPPLERLLPRTGSVAVLISDLTRGAAAARLLRPLLEELERLGAGPERVTVILALGLHRGRGGAALAAHLGADILSRWTVVEHDARDGGSLVDVGATASGTPCALNRAAVDSALVITLGAVAFHYFAGYGGARKLILPGIASESAILANHRLSLRADAGAGLSAGCRPGVLDGNPVHEDMLAGARLLETRVFSVNVVAGARGEALFINAGDLDASHRAACEFLSAHMRIPLARLYRAVVFSAGGFPKDIDLLQSHKAIRHASYALEEGGLMLAAAECGEGVGSESYAGAFERGRLAVPGRVRAGYTANAQAAVSTCELVTRFSIYLKSAMDDALVGRFGFCPWKPGYEDYLLAGLADGEILVIENASLFLPGIEAAAGPARG
ncbi:MAG: nickel-dependent lactate racemase [Candidatus Latescibacterota bacterium]|nr:MAG: nickel-dependent lactate racemase [Candidatus Latescibacterota bacterium]